MTQTFRTMLNAFHYARKKKIYIYIWKSLTWQLKNDFWSWHLTFLSAHGLLDRTSNLVPLNYKWIWKYNSSYSQIWDYWMVNRIMALTLHVSFHQILGSHFTPYNKRQVVLSSGGIGNLHLLLASCMMSSKIHVAFLDISIRILSILASLS